jgi:3'-phosphoadenosine 5'-phosphosulfate sulfotransferase (PAPS reductase)/FAD synthetase
MSVAKAITASHQHTSVELPSKRPTAIVVSLSGGKDSTELLRRIVTQHVPAQGWQDIPVMVHHQVVAEDWDGTVEYCKMVCDYFGVPLHLSRAHYFGYACRRREFGSTPCRFNTLTSSVEKYPLAEGNKCPECQEATLDKLAEVGSLTELIRWRGAYPSPKIRFCTSYLKRDVFNLWVRRNRTMLGNSPVVALGERWAESPGRRKLPFLKVRESVSVQGFEMVEWRPILHLSRREVFRGILEGTTLDVHDCYYKQGMTREQMLHENEEGGARMSCVMCFYNTDSQLKINGNLPENATLFERLYELEEVNGHTIREGKKLVEIVRG